jgi:predicted nucleic acid-binding protein
VIPYVDTSTLIKLIIEEAGSERAALIWDTADDLTTVRLTKVEARATLAAAARARRITPPQHRAAVEELELLWSSLIVVEVTAALIEQAGEIAASHSLRGYDAVHLAAAIAARADMLSSSDKRLCAAAKAEGMHIANPLDSEPVEPAQDQPEPDLAHLATGVTHGLASQMTGDSGIYGIPLPEGATPDPDRSGFVRVSGIGPIQDLVAFYREWMADDGWIFDADYGEQDPYAMEQRKLGGYFVQIFFVKPTTPPTTVGIIVGNADGRPGHKHHLTINVAQTPDDELPRRSVRLGSHDH